MRLFQVLFICMTFITIKAQKINIPKSISTDSAAEYAEELYLHTDKTTYIAGEIVWFKVYSLNRFSKLPLQESSICYVELLNKDHKPVSQSILTLTDAQANGSFQLTYAISTGNYTIRAYTKKMQSFSNTLFFEKKLRLINTLKNGNSIKVNQHEYQFNFLPEGGSIIAGFPAKVGCKATDAFGKGIAFKGWLLNLQKDTIASFSSFYKGMGSFSFTPLAIGKAYTAVVLFESGKRIIIDFPAIEEKGYSLQAETLLDNSVKVTTRANTGSRKLTIILHNQISIQSTYLVSLNEQKAEIIIPASVFVDGVSAITLINEQGNPVAERLLFTLPKKKLRIELTGFLDTIVTRKTVSANLLVRDKDGNPISGNFSGTVFRIDELQKVDSANILSNIWLESWLRGTVECPFFYFQENTDSKKALENLLLTQGWRSFVRNKREGVLSIISEKEGHLMEGNIRYKENGVAVTNETIYLSVPGKKSLFYTTVTNSKGDFVFDVNQLYGNNELILQVSLANKKQTIITLKSPFSNELTVLDNGVVFQNDSLLKEELLQKSIWMQAQNYYEEKNIQQFTLPKYNDTLPFYGIADKKYALDDYTRFILMEEVIKEYIAEVRLKKTNSGYEINALNKPFNIFFENEPLLLLDGVPIFGTNQLLKIDPLKIKQLELINRQYQYHAATYNGIIALSSYNGDLEGFTVDSNSIQIAYSGIQLERVFYSPLYENGEKTDLRKPDYRNVLLWQPNIITDQTGKATIRFASSDIDGKYCVIIQGITNSGAGYCESYIVVKE